MSLRAKYEARWNATPPGPERAALLAEIFAELSDKQLEYVFVMAAARDEHAAAERLHAELLRRKARAAEEKT